MVNIPNRIAFIHLSGLIVSSLMLSGPAISQELAPMEEREYQIGDTWVNEKRDGSEISSELTSISGDDFTFMDDDGCSYVLGRDFRPSASWKDCGGSSGKQTVTSASGSIWPLQVGKSITFDYEESSGSRKWSNSSRKCKVTGTEMVTVPAGTFDTFVDVCTNGGNRSWQRTRWLSPELGIQVQYKRYHMGQNNISTFLKLKRFEPGN